MDDVIQHHPWALRGNCFNKPGLNIFPLPSLLSTVFVRVFDPCLAGFRGDSSKGVHLSMLSILCDVNYVGYTSRHLRIEQYKHSVIGKHRKDEHNQRPNNLREQFVILRKCCRKFECLIYDLLLLREKRPTLNTQKDPIAAKVFI